MPVAGAQPSLSDKVAYLLRGDTYAPPVAEVTRHETHMSQVFLAGDRVYKLKKPVQFPYLDFSTLARREAACRAELRLNRRLAADTYLGVVPLTQTVRGLAIGGAGETVDWLVVMKRLDARAMLDRVIAEGRLQTWQLDRLAAVLVGFYRRASAVLISPAAHAAALRQSLAYNRRVLFDPRFALPAGSIRYVDTMQRRFLTERRALLDARVRARRIIDGHGDLRPEHICLGDPVQDHRLPGVQCAPAHGRSVRRDRVPVRRMRAAGRPLGRRISAPRIMRALNDGHSEELFVFYRCHRATLAGAARHRASVRAPSAHAGEMGAARAALSAARRRPTPCGSNARFRIPTDR